MATRALPQQRRYLELLFVGLALLGLAAPALAQGTQLERAVKATYLYKFAPFVEWPDQAAEFPSGTFIICIVGNDPLDGLVDRVIQGQEVAGRPIALQRHASISGRPTCSVMLVSAPDPQSSAQILAAVRGMPVLTVTDGARDPPAKGIINFVVEDNRVRFEIDASAAAANNLAISSKLLGLAARVTPREPAR